MHATRLTPRLFSSTTGALDAGVRAAMKAQAPDALVVGARREAGTGTGFELTFADHVADGVANTLAATLKASRFSAKKGASRVVVCNVAQKSDARTTLVAVVGLSGSGSQSEFTKAEEARTAAAAGINAIRALNKEESFRVAVQPFNNNAKAAAEGAVLTAYTYNENKKIKMGEISTILYAPGAGVTLVDDWLEGVIGASAQNTARHLMETPANLLTPHLFSQRVTSLLASLPNTTVTVRDMAWIEAERMGMFLSVARGSAEEPRFLEIRYSGGESNSTAAAATPIALVGKGVTFDSGGISIKPSNGMADMKGDMGGAAVVVGIMEAIAKLRLRVNIVACIPLTENMPSGTATKPGDVVVARNGKTVEVDNTDAEGRLILGDAIHYACTTFHPKTVIELSTLTGAVDVALGYPYAGVFTTSDELWSRLENASKSAGEGFWRMPMDVDAYKPQIKSNVADLKNVGGRSAGSCTAAVFLQEFVEGGVEFAHIDIAGVMKQTGSHGILARGMTGRPVRAIIEYIKEASK